VNLRGTRKLVSRSITVAKGARYKTTCRVSLELTKQHQNIRVTCHSVLDTLFPFRCSARKSTRTDKIVRNNLYVTSSEFTRHEEISIEKHSGLKGFSIQRLFQDATRTDKIVRNNHICHFECFHCARAKIKMYREAFMFQSVLDTTSLSGRHSN